MCVCVCVCVCVCQNSKAVVVEVEFDKWMLSASNSGDVSSRFLLLDDLGVATLTPLYIPTLGQSLYIQKRSASRGAE